MQAPARSRNWIRAGLRLGTASLVAGSGTVWVAVLPAQVASAAVFSVTNCNDSGAGSLRAEAAAAPSGHTITFASSVTSCSPILLTSGPITLTKNVTITGLGAGTLGISGNGSAQVFTVSSAVTNSTITGLTIENGNAGPGINGANNNVPITASNGTADPDSGGNGGNCAFAGGTVSDGGYNLDSGTTCQLSASTDKNGVDPQLGPLQANGGPTQTMAPSATSPVIDAIPAGTNGCGTTVKTDQRGVHRPQGSGCDIGAYETGDVNIQSLSAKPSPVPTGANLTYTVTVANAGAAAATGVSMADTLPAGITFTSAKASQGSCARQAKTVTCTLGSMPAASTASITIIVHVTAASGSNLSDTATVSATTGDTVPGNDTKTAKVKVT